MSQRIQRVNQLIKQELSQILCHEFDFSKETLVTLTRVETSADLRESKVYVSVIPETEIKKIIKILNQNLRKIQKKINKRLEMKIIPKIEFREETKTREAARIEELLEKIKNEEKNEEND